MFTSSSKHLRFLLVAPLALLVPVAAYAQGEAQPAQPAADAGAAQSAQPTADAGAAPSAVAATTSVDAAAPPSAASSVAPPTASPPSAARAPAPAPDPTPAPVNNQSMGFLSRFLDGYTTQHAYVSTLPVPPRRSMPDALDAPPFPASHWSLNGTPDIGIPDTTVYPLMGAVYGSGAVGKAIEESRIKLYGWADTTLNASTSTSYRGN